MPISAAVITLEADKSRQERAIAALDKDPRLTLGERQERQLPVVIETDNFSDGITLVRDELPEMEGVEFVHVVSVDFSDAESFDEKLPRKRRRQKSQL